MASGNVLPAWQPEAHGGMHLLKEGYSVIDVRCTVRAIKFARSTATHGGGAAAED